MPIFDPGPLQISDYIADINRLIISLNQSNSSSIPLVRTPNGASEMLAVLNQTVQGLNKASGVSIPLFAAPQDTSAFLSLINTLNILGAGAATLPSVPGFFNFTGSNLSNWSTALAAQQGGTANAKLACLGDSTVVGYQSVLTNFTGAKAQSWPTKLARDLLANGSWSSQWGDANSTNNASSPVLYDARLAAVNWTVANTTDALGGCNLQEISPNVGAWSLTPTNQIDTIEVWWMGAPAGQGIFTIDVDGGAVLVTQDTIQPSAYTVTRVTCALGNHTINVKRTTGRAAAVAIDAVVAYNSAVKEISVYNWGGYGWNSAKFSTNASVWSPINGYGKVNPHLTIFEAGIINDWNAGTARATVTANQTAAINALKAAGSDVILMSGAPSNPATKAAYATQLSYINDMKALAYSLNVPFIDAFALLGGAWSNTFMGDDLHPNGVGYGNIAGYANTALSPAFRAA